MKIEYIESKNLVKSPNSWNPIARHSKKHIIRLYEFLEKGKILRFENSYYNDDGETCFQDIYLDNNLFINKTYYGHGNVCISFSNEKEFINIYRKFRDIPSPLKLLNIIKEEEQE